MAAGCQGSVSPRGCMWVGAGAGRWSLVAAQVGFGVGGTWCAVYRYPRGGCGRSVGFASGSSVRPGLLNPTGLWLPTL